MMELYKENREKTGPRVELLAPAGNYEAFLGLSTRERMRCI